MVMEAIVLDRKVNRIGPLTKYANSKFVRRKIKK